MIYIEDQTSVDALRSTFYRERRYTDVYFFLKYHCSLFFANGCLHIFLKWFDLHCFNKCA